MKVSIAYHIKDVVIEVDDKYKELIDSNSNISNRDWGDLQDELIGKAYDEIPVDADIVSIYDDDTDVAIFEL